MFFLLRYNFYYVMLLPNIIIKIVEAVMTTEIVLISWEALTPTIV